MRTTATKTNSPVAVVHLYADRYVWKNPSGRRKTYARNADGRALLANDLVAYGRTRVHYRDHRRPTAATNRRLL